MIVAICIRCGSPKDTPWKQCRACGFDPTEDDVDLAKSVYLSLARFQSDEERRRYQVELEQVALAIQDGSTPEFDGNEIDRLLQERDTIKAVPLSAVWGAVVRLFAPGLVLLVLLVVVYCFFQWLKNG